MPHTRQPVRRPGQGARGITSPHSAPVASPTVPAMRAAQRPAPQRPMPLPAAPEDFDSDGETWDDDETGKEDDGYASWGFIPPTGPEGAQIVASQYATQGNTADEPLEEYTAESYQQDRLVRMPSGKALRLRMLSLTGLIAADLVPPNHLKTALRLSKLDDAAQQPEQQQQPRNRAEARARGQQSAAQSQSQSEPQGQSTTRAAIDFLDWLCTELIVSFRAVQKPPEQCQPGEVSTMKITDPDKSAILTFALEGQTALVPFRV